MTNLLQRRTRVPRVVRPVIAALLFAAAPTGVRAEPLPASLTVAGGVSLGAYEAGLAYYSIETLRANPGMTEFKLATGASAGSVNGLVSLLQSCSAAVPDPRQSLFWKAWIPLGLDALTRPVETQATAAFTRTAFEVPLKLIGAAWAGGLRADCDVVFGVSVTRLEPRMVSVKGERLRLPRVEEHFLLRIQGRGAGKAPRLTNYVDPTWEGDQALLIEEPNGEVPFTGLIDAIFASTAFPGAFPPQPVRHCIVNGGAGKWPGCPVSSARKDLFVDGGVFDNTPIRLATGAAAGGLRITDGVARWLDRPDMSKQALPEPMVFSYISTDARTFPTSDNSAASKVPVSILGVAARVGGSFYDSARAKNLLYIHDESPEFFEKLVIPERHLPAASSPLGAFFGFFEEQFRVFDFTLGMYDGRRMAEARLAPRLAKAGRADKMVLPETVPGAVAAAESWQPYRCLRATLDDPPSAEAACKGEALRDFRIVLQSSIERLWDRCARLEQLTGVFADDPLCRAAADGRPPLQVFGVAPIAGNGWRRAEGENEVAYTLRLLSTHGMEFKDLGLKREEAAEAPARLRTRLLQIGDQVARTQPGGQAAVVETGVKLGADSVTYVPPRYTGWGLFGRDLEAGASVGFLGEAGSVASVRFSAALQINNTARVLSSEEGALAFTALVGVEVLPAALASTALQPSLIARGGVLLASRDNYGTGTCPEPDSEIVGSCSRPTVGVGLAATALERIRVQILFNYYFAPKEGTQVWWAISPGFGVQWAF